MKTKAAVAVLGLAAAAFAFPAAAQMNMSAVYVGGGLGQSKFADACNGVSGCDDKDTAFKLFAGWQFNPYIAAEFGYTDLGKAKAGSSDLKGTAWELSALGSFPVGANFSILGRLGGYHGELKGESPLGSASESKTGVTYGLGAGYDLNKNLGFRAEWQRFDKMGGGNVGETSVDVFGASVLWRFK
jgi:OOP family OmpA-OmpF porin